MDRLRTIADIEKEAERRCDQHAWQYFSATSTEGTSVTDNMESFRRWKLRPRVMRDVSEVDLTTKIFGQTVSFPVGIAPTAYHKWAHQDGERATAKACRKMNVVYIQSVAATCSFEEVARSCPNCRQWIHAFFTIEEDLTYHLIKMGERIKSEAVVITVDHPVKPSHNGSAASVTLPEDFSFPNFPKKVMEKHNNLNFLINQAATWKDMKNLKMKTKMKVIVKGILTGEMAQEAIELGNVDGIIVSNHGGRQLDSTISPLEALPEVVKAVDGRCPVFMDGGIRTGTDVLKAVALGATAVFIGRPVLWGLVCGGDKGLCRVLEVLKEEYSTAMKLMGIKSTDELRTTPGLLRNTSSAK